MPLMKLLRRYSDKHIDSNSKDQKAGLGMKVIKAQQNPEPIYDLSSCSTTALPDDTYIYCKILGKTTLLINNNLLDNLESGGSLNDLNGITFLDASVNKISELPSNVSTLQNLTVLNLSDNKLKSLPASFEKLSCLEVLNISKNKFTSVPVCVCSLPKLESLNICGNNISALPEQFCQLQHSLVCLDADLSKLSYPPQTEVESLESVMKFICNDNGTEYKPTKPVSVATTKSICLPETTDMIDGLLIDQNIQKQQQRDAQMLIEQEMKTLEKIQWDNMLRTGNQNKEQLLSDLISEGEHITEYKASKQLKCDDHLRLEKELKIGQDRELGAYLDTAQNKETLLLDISHNESCMQKEVSDIVAAKDKHKEKILVDLSKTEHKIELALSEIIQSTKMSKSADLVVLVKEQEEQMDMLINHLVEVSSDLHRKDVMAAMEKTILEELILQSRCQTIEDRQLSLITSLDSSVQIELGHLDTLMKSKLSNQSDILSDLISNEKYQAEAFKILLQKLDLRRNDVIRQITLVEYELLRLSSLELCKKSCGIKDDTSTREQQRKTLIDVLGSLNHARDERDSELDVWVQEVAGQRNSGQCNEDFWLCQYQKLMTLKPSGLVQAEAIVDDDVKEILYVALATDLLPHFARQEISFVQLMNMSETDFEEIGVGAATYGSIQRALQAHLQKTKLNSDDTFVPSAPELPEDTESVSPAACAPPLENHYFETECVVCLNKEPCVIFMTCGHVCVCDICCPSLAACPLCRAQIGSKCLLNKF